MVYSYTYILYFLIVVCEICINTPLRHIRNFRIEEQLDCIGSSNLLGLLNGYTSIAKIFYLFRFAATALKIISGLCIWSDLEELTAILFVPYWLLILLRLLSFRARRCHGEKG